MMILWLIFKLFMFISGFAFWAFLIWTFSGIRKSIVFSKQYKFLGYTIDVESEAQKGLKINIKK